MIQMIYTEKGKIVYQKANDGIERQTAWKGYVALMYPSDYGYAAAKTCKSNLFDYNQDDNCVITGNWLYNGGEAEWLITPDSDDADCAWYFTDYVSLGDSTTNHNVVRPTLYLKSNVKITGGDGTKDVPYELSM